MSSTLNDNDIAKMILKHGNNSLKVSVISDYINLEDLLANKELALRLIDFANIDDDDWVLLIEADPNLEILDNITEICHTSVITSLKNAAQRVYNIDVSNIVNFIRHVKIRNGDHISDLIKFYLIRELEYLLVHRYKWRLS